MAEPPPKHVRSLSTSTVIYKPTSPPSKLRQPATSVSSTKRTSGSSTTSLPSAPKPKINVASDPSKLVPRTVTNARSATPAFKVKGSFEFKSQQPTNRLAPIVKPTNAATVAPSKPTKPDRKEKAALAEKARAMLKVDWVLVETKMPTGKDPESTKRRRLLFKQFDILGDGRITVASTHKTITSVLNMWNMFPPQVVQLAHQAAAAYTGDGPPPKFSKRTPSVGEFVDWNKFRMLLVYLRQHLELWVIFDAVNMSRDGHMKESEFVENFHLLQQYGFDFPDPLKSFHEIKMSKNASGVLFKDFAHWGLTRKLHIEANLNNNNNSPNNNNTEDKNEETNSPQLSVEISKQQTEDKQSSNNDNDESSNGAESDKFSQTSERRISSSSTAAENIPPGRASYSSSLLPSRLSQTSSPPPSPRLSQSSCPPAQSPRTPSITVVPPALPPKPSLPPHLPPRVQVIPPEVPPHHPHTFPQTPSHSNQNHNNSGDTNNDSNNPDYVQEGEAEGDEENGEGDEDEDDVDGAEENDVAADRYRERKTVEEELSNMRSTEQERLEEYALLEFEIVRAPETKVVKGVIRDFSARGGRGALCFTDALDYMENCMFEAEEAEYDEEEKAREAELESSEEEDDCDPFFPSWLDTTEGDYNSDNDGQFMERVQEAECEVCEDKHAAQVRCLECEENMCEKLGLAHKKSKIGKDHTMEQPKFELPKELEPQRKSSAEANLEKAAAEKIAAFKVMMDAKVRNLRTGRPVVQMPGGEQRLRVGPRTWGKVSLAKCELCEEQHIATVFCVDCGQNMCQKMGAAHVKSKIGRAHELKSI